jgi:hypothetical protein
MPVGVLLRRFVLLYLRYVANQVFLGYSACGISVGSYEIGSDCLDFSSPVAPTSPFGLSLSKPGLVG